MSALSPCLNPGVPRPLQRFPRRAPLAAAFPFTAFVGTETLVPTAGGALTVNAPGAGSRTDGAMFAVTDADGSAGTNAITISGNGKNIDGQASVTLNVANGTLVFIFDDFDDQWHRCIYPRQVTDPIDSIVLVYDLAAMIGPLMRISTLYGDGTAGSPNSPQNNPSHILGDVISWEPAAASSGGTQWYCKEVSVNGLSVNNAPTVLTLVPIANLETYAIDITMSAKRHDGTGVSERLKLSGVVSRDDALGGGVQYDSTQTETDTITTKAGTAPVLSLLLDTTGNNLSVIFGAIAGAGNTAEYAGAIRLARQLTTA